MNSEEQFSMIVSEALDVLGYNREIVTERRTTYDILSKFVTERGRCDSKIKTYATISGSKREGLAGFLDRDMDCMLTLNDVKCSDDPASVPRDVSYIFELVREGCPHGYTKLRLYYRNVHKMVRDIERSLIDYPDGSYVSSTRFMEEIMTDREPMDHVFNNGCNEPRAGPSNPYTQFDTRLEAAFSFDRATSFCCQCTDYLQSWINRPRDFDWPSRDQIDTAATVDAHVVPVGAKSSENTHLEWRICYTLPEINLMQSLNETKWKLYVILKMIKDLVFKPLGDLLTSYSMKNVIMWISESDPIEAFQPKYILRKTRQCLDFLIKSFLSKRLPNYMISDRNLLESRLNDRNTEEYLNALNRVRKNLSATILQCTQLGNAMVKVYTARATARAEMMERNRQESATLRLVTFLNLDAWCDFCRRAPSCSTSLDLHYKMLRVLASNLEMTARMMNVSVVHAAARILYMQMMTPEEVRRIYKKGIEKMKG